MESNERTRTWERRLNEAKAKHRPKLRNWKKDKFADKSILGRYEDFNQINNLSSHIIELTQPRENPENQETLTHIDRISSENLTYNKFIINYEIPALPCVIQDIPENENWLAYNKWNLSNKSYFNDVLGDRFYKVGEDDDGSLISSC